MIAKQVTADVSGFTPCPDILVEKYSHTTALVWGKVWRYCQMKDEVCRAAIQRLADDLGLSPNTIATHIAKLESGGYVKDLTPDVRNKPHEYVDTGKLRLKINIFMDENGTQNLSTRSSKIGDEESSSSIFSIFENNIGPITPLQADTLIDAEKTYPKQWILDAIRLAVENNKRSWRYCETILSRWQRDGKDDGKGKPAAQPAPSFVPDMDDFDKQYGFA